MSVTEIDAAISRAHSVIDANFDRYVEEIRHYLRTPGISQTGEGIRESAELTLKIVAGLDRTAVRIEESDGNPVVLGTTLSANPNSKTLLVYSFYDLVPVVANDWVAPPFDAAILDAQQIGLPAQLGKLITARGINDHKGPLAATVLALRAMQEAGAGPPVNILHLYEGEEEIESPSLPAFVARHRDELALADAFWFPRMSRTSDTAPMVVHRGYKGMIRVLLVTESGDWGGTLDRRDIWGANAAWVDSPLRRLLTAVTSLVDENGEICLDGFFDHVIPVSSDEEHELARILDKFDETTTRNALKIARFKGGAKGRDLLRRYIMGPSANVAFGGIPGSPDDPEHSKGLIDGTLRPEQVMRAWARIDFRLVPNLEPDLVLRLIREHLDRRGLSEIQVRGKTAGYSWSRTSPNAGVYRALERACARHGIEPIIWPTMTSCAPFDLFSRAPLQLPMIVFGAACGGWFHEPNEYGTLEGLRTFMKFTVTWLHEWAKEDGP